MQRFDSGPYLRGSLWPLLILSLSLVSLQLHNSRVNSRLRVSICGLLPRPWDVSRPLGGHSDLLLELVSLDVDFFLVVARIHQNPFTLEIHSQLEFFLNSHYRRGNVSILFSSLSVTGAVAGDWGRRWGLCSSVSSGVFLLLQIWVKNELNCRTPSHF